MLYQLSYIRSCHQVGRNHEVKLYSHAKFLANGVSSICGPYWDRTSDLFRVREARYRCANRPCCEVETGFEPVCTALQAAASPLGHSTVRVGRPVDRCRVSERTTGFEPATLTLAR